MRSLEPTFNFPHKSKLVRQHSGRHLRALGLGSDGAYRVKARRVEAGLARERRRLMVRVPCINNCQTAYSGVTFYVFVVVALFLMCFWCKVQRRLMLKGTLAGM